MSAIILDAGGRVKAFQKQDGASMLRFEVCYGKAYGSLALGRPSRLVLAKAREKPLFMQSIDNLADYPLFLEGGGQLIRDPDGEVVGAIGVTGDVNEMDDICAICRHPCRSACARTTISTTPSRSRRLSIIKGPPHHRPAQEGSRQRGRRNNAPPRAEMAEMAAVRPRSRQTGPRSSPRSAMVTI